MPPYRILESGKNERGSEEKGMIVRLRERSSEGISVLWYNRRPYAGDL